MDSAVSTTRRIPAALGVGAFIENNGIASFAFCQSFYVCTAALHVTYDFRHLDEKLKLWTQKKFLNNKNERGWFIKNILGRKAVDKMTYYNVMQCGTK